ncbi:c-type cytochrome biogenesis protein CcmI [Aquirhabdus sp.]|uniref:c-type cytochrome biogenesis protein CcmI n=1 Tax=Aquirhabdus sp. TaxID=2824160 RepID=UPI00396CF70F
MTANSTLIMFWGAALILSLLLALIVISPWLRRTKIRQTLIDLNISVFRERLAELESDYQQAKLGTQEYQGQKVDLERQLIAAADHDVARVQKDQLGRRVSVQHSARLPKIIILIVFLWVPVFTLGAYFLWSLHKRAEHTALVGFWSAQDQYGKIAEQLMTGQINTPPADATEHGIALLQALQANIYQHPLEAKRWVVLSQTYMAAEAMEPALATLAHAYRLNPEDDDIAMTYAQMRFFSEQGKIDDVALSLVQHILSKNPNHEGALMLMAMATYRAHLYDDAINWLQRLKAVRIARATPDQPINPAILAQLNTAIEDAKQARMQVAKSQADSTLTITVQLADSLVSKITARDTLFVYIRAAEGVPAPYAVKKLTGPVLMNQLSHHQPLELTLSDQDSMLTDRTISSAHRQGTPLIVAARVSKSSNPTGESGDLESLPVPLDDRLRYTVDVDQVRP